MSTPLPMPCVPNSEADVEGFGTAPLHVVAVTKVDDSSPCRNWSRPIAGRLLETAQLRRIVEVEKQATQIGSQSALSWTINSEVELAGVFNHHDLYVGCAAVPGM